MWGFTRAMRGMASNVARASRPINNQINASPLHNAWANLYVLIYAEKRSA